MGRRFSLGTLKKVIYYCMKGGLIMKGKIVSRFYLITLDNK